MENKTALKGLTFVKWIVIYCAGLLTYGIYQNYTHEESLADMKLMMLDSSSIDTTSMSYPCACENDDRFNVDPKDDSQNFPISTVAECSTMVGGAGSDRTGEPKGAWFSKVTLDLMFCHKPDANGIFVYKGADDQGQPVFIIEADRNNRIVSRDDGLATIYYSRALCPMICGACGL